MKKFITVLALLCAFVVNACPAYPRPGCWKCPRPPHGYGLCRNDGRWAAVCAAATAGAMIGAGGAAWASGNSSIVVVPPAPTTTAFFTPAQQPQAAVVLPAPVAGGPIYTSQACPSTVAYVNPAPVTTTVVPTTTIAPAANNTVVVVPPSRPCHKHPLVGVDVLGLRVGIDY